MRKKELWMFKGAIVLALGKKAVITAMQENEMVFKNGEKVDYVYYIDCKVEGEKRAGRYHPNDIQELIISENK